MARLRAFVVVAPGLEALALDELRSLGITGRARTERGGIEVDLTTRQLYVVHRRGRLPGRVLVRLAVVPIKRFDELEDVVRSIDWSPFLRGGTPVSVHAASHRSRLYHDGAIVERVERLLDRPIDDEHGQRVHLRFDRDVATISVDASGEPLHHRGWRSDAHAAPLRATLAAALVRAAGYDGSVPLVDPMCGSGTIALEAAAVALGRPQERAFAFERWPSFEPGTWASAARSPVGAAAAVPAAIVAADRDAGAVAMTTAHALAAGVAESVEVQHAALTKQRWPEAPGLVVVNPPYGHRLGEVDALRDLYASLGRRVADGGHRLCLLTSEQRLAKACGIPLEERFATTNGGLAVRAYVSPRA